MSERPSPALRNQRKHFVKCVDCSCQMLPQNAPRERPWAAAATLYISGRVNDGSLCFKCSNNRRELLGLPVEKEADSGSSKADCGRLEIAPASAATPKKININKREYAWDVSTLDSLIVKWREQQFYEEYKNPDVRWWLVVINERSIPPVDFGSVQISDGDEISIVLGRGRYS
jgi:hypothetical protein